MAEVLGVVSSIIAIVGVAGKLGTSTFKLKRLWDEVQDVPTNIQRCIEQLEILAPAIQDMESEFERTREMVQNDTAAKRSLEYSQKAMDTLDALIKDMEGRIESARRGKKLLTQLKVRLKKDVLEEHQQRLQFALQLVSLSQQTYLIAVTRAQPSIIMAEWRNLQEHKQVAQPSSVECPGQDEDSVPDATAVAEIPSNNAVLGHSNWWPTIKGMPRRKPGLLGSFTYRVEEEASEECIHLARRNTRVHQARLQLPRWILQKTWDFQFYRSYDGWKFQLKNWNICPNDSPIFRFAEKGRTDLILEAFDRNEASLHDVNEDGDTLIEISMLFHQYNLAKDLHTMGLKTSNSPADQLVIYAMISVYLLYDDEATMEFLELCREGEEFSNLLDFPNSGAGLFDTGTTALLLNLRFSCPEFNMFPPQQSTRIITDELRWDVIDPKTALDMLARGFARPDFLRKTNLEYFAWAYFHALLNEAQPEPWRLLTRKLFAGAGPEEVVLPPLSSLEVRNLNYDQIRFYHPGYLKPLNLLFCLPRVDYSAEDNAYGVHYRTALTACQIVANNAFEKGRLARDDKGQDIVADDEKVLLERDYWFFIEDDERYAVVPCFNDWQFPHDKLPDWWIAPTSSLGLHTKRCAVTNTSYAFTWAHLIPKEEQQWFNKNGMGLYGGGSHSLDDQHNILPLKADLYVCFDQSVFALVPKQHREPNGELRTEYVLHVLDARESEFAALYQDRPIKCLVSGSREYLFARFAWTVISRIKPFLTSGVGRRVVRFRVRACDGDTDEENLRAEMQNVFMDAKKLEALYGGGGRKRAVSLEDNVHHLFSWMPRGMTFTRFS
ncbi:hypothetical protein NCS57_00315600 [Fusarium keratoplasticum]|uniref:Uncharacterized protein n=1 Tax=Fusarium keratoplasticum TaxID=1328300 RepID=A0ACC0RDW3_9HYPO|nr:hypothetical protein NCS57_00315600 [Fusarium keratoplasticum]KAI8680351.1 hypothetical protein NCS57_00315600 [Fusarium keratoplasticum]